jgi:ATP-dependent DNA helicase DinG
VPASVLDILGPDGAIARRLGDRYESRPQQIEMASAVERAFAQKHHLLVEAGTGTGKSFAYLLPAIDYAVRHKKRVVISTHTIALQEQLIEKDIPLLQSVYPDEFTAVLVKGRGNYLCQRRLKQSRSKQNYLFDRDAQLQSLWRIEQWAQDSLEHRDGADGSAATLPVLPDPSIWDLVNAEQGNCLGKKCEFYESCFWQAAKRRMGGGNLLIVNHALFFSDLALRSAGVNYLPKYELVAVSYTHLTLPTKA